MPPRIGDIDRWIEEGLTRYGKGEVDAALEAWETALSIDPDNPLANSYVDYVRQNYELLTTTTAGSAFAGSAADFEGLPYPIGDGESADYQIEIMSGEMPPVMAGPIVKRPSMEAVDEGWAIDDEQHRAMPTIPMADVPNKKPITSPPQNKPLALPIPAPRASRPDLDSLTFSTDSDRPSRPNTPAPLDDDDEPEIEIGISRTISAESSSLEPGSSSPPRIELELDADLPNLELERSPRIGTDGGMTFDDATREYQKGRPPTRDLDLASIPGRAATNDFERAQQTPAFGSPHDVQTPPFGSPQDLQTPGGFGHQVTGIRKRDTGFVKPSAAVKAEAVPIAREPAAPTTPPGPSQTLQGLVPLAQAPAPPRAKRASAVPELQMTLRTPAIPPADRNPSDDDDLGADITLERRDVGLPDEATSPRVSRIDLAIANAEPQAPVVAPAPPPRQPTRDEHLEPTLGPSGSRTTTIEREEEERLFGADVATKDLPTGRDLLELGAAGGARAASTRELDSRAAADAAAAGAALRPSTREMPGATRPPGSPSRPPATQPTHQTLPGQGAPPIASQPTRDLGIRPGSMRLPTEEEATGQIELRPPIVGAGGASARTPKRSAEAAPTNLIDTTAQLVMDAVERDAPADETKDDRTRRRITSLLERAAQWMSGGEPDKAVAAIDLALEEDAASALAQKLVHRNRDAIMAVFQTYLGDLQRQPVLARPLSELANAPISPRAAFLLSRIDGMLSLDEILDVSGMPRLEAYRYLCQLFLRGILK